MSPKNHCNNKTCNDAIAMLEAGGKTLWAVEVIRNRIRLILADPKEVAHNEEYKKLVLAFEELQKEYSNSNEIRELMQIDIDDKAGIIADQSQELQNAYDEIQSLKEQNARFKEENATHNSLGHKCESLEKELEMKDNQISMKDDELKKIHDLQKALDLRTANQATKVQSLESETRSLKDQLELAKTDSSNYKEESEKAKDMVAINAAIIDNLQVKLEEQKNANAGAEDINVNDVQEQSSSHWGSDSENASTRSEYWA